MAHWNYRVIDHGDHFALHEVHYRDDGEPASYTTAPISFVADPEEGAAAIVAGLEMALRDARERAVLPVSVFTGGSRD